MPAALAKNVSKMQASFAQVSAQTAGVQQVNLWACALVGLCGACALVCACARAWARACAVPVPVRVRAERSHQVKRGVVWQDRSHMPTRELHCVGAAHEY
jgi:hypothetical protein